MKKVISMVLTLALLFALSVPALATDGQALLSAPKVPAAGEAPTGALKGAGTTTVPYRTTKAQDDTTVSVTIYGTFDVNGYLDDTFYISAMAFNALAFSSSDKLYYVKNGSASVTGYVDGGRTMIVTENFDVFSDNALHSTTSVNAYFFFNKNTGSVSAQ